jgi:hypothetical protein
MICWLKKSNIQITVNSMLYYHIHNPLRFLGGCWIISDSDDV